VKVTNSANNPVVTQDVGQSASQMVYLSCTSANTAALDCYQYRWEPSGPGVYPGLHGALGRYLVITAVDVNTFNPSTGGLVQRRRPYNLRRRLETTPFQVRLDPGRKRPTTHFTYPPGFALAPGTDHSI